jgi:uncharacterized protein (DUF1697 family)
MARHIALLRGINVGGNRMVAMPALRELLEREGHQDVRTYVQSGNLVLTSRKGPDNLARDLERQIAEGMGVEVDVLVRTRDELADVIARLPFEDVTKDKRLHVAFLWKPLPRIKANELEAADLGPEKVAVDGREIYAWYPDGVQRSPLAKLLTDHKLGAKATDRNWNTVAKLLEMADQD